MTSEVRARVLVAEDHELVLDGLIRTLQGVCQIIGTARNGRDAVELSRVLKPDIVLMDVTMPLLNGVEAARQITKANPEVKIIVVTMQIARDYVRAAFEAGVSGYVVKQAAASQLLTAIREVQSGRRFLSSTIAERYLQDDLSGQNQQGYFFTALTPRQREVLQLVAEGRSAKEIGSSLFISAKTVEFHKKQLMEELGVHSSAELVRCAFEEGWVGR